MRLIAFLLYFILTTTESSKCPESRKPHSTSCTVFYNCVNLPGGGYVWVPSKCTKGLIFQPYLRMCVLPGDSWTCDSLSSELSVITNRYDVPELIDPNETSYMGFTEDPPNFSELIDSSHTTDSIPDASDQEMATPYPLIEIEESIEDKHDSNYNNSTINAVQNGYLQTQDEFKSRYSMLNRLMHHLLIYKELTIPLEFLASSSLSTPSRLASNVPLSNYLIQNYIQQNNNLQNTIVTAAKIQSTTEGDTMTNIERPNNPQAVLDNLEDENNIISIADNAGNKQYITIEKYKSLGYHVEAQFVHVIPCIKNIRMPNMTDCVRYYVCEPETVSVIEYSCPANSAFNKYKRTCDTETYHKCIEDKNKRGNMNFLESVDNVSQSIMTTKNVCTEHGKTKDPTSESRYYICYSTADNSHAIKSIRMTCPNGLIFCQTKKVCTTKRLCKIT